MTLCAYWQQLYKNFVHDIIFILDVSLQRSNGGTNQRPHYSVNFLQAIPASGLGNCSATNFHFLSL
jgi:hypothetical protein